MPKCSRMIEGHNSIYGTSMYRRADPGMSSLSHDQYLADGYGSPSAFTKRDMPISDLETKPGPPRKRVPVACERCRKRKIKCSGDQGDGSGCDNCKSAGWDGCAFLRVRSEALQYHGHNRMWQNQHRFHPYGAGISRQQRYLHHQQPTIHHHIHPVFNTWPKADYSGIGTPGPGIPWTANPYSNSFAAYEAEATNAYAGQPPSYMLHELDNSARSEMCLSLGSRPQPGIPTTWTDNMNEMSISQPLSSIYPTGPIEGIKSYSMAPEQHMIGTERTLPTPSILPDAAPLPLQNDGETPPLSAVSHRSSHTWDSSNASNTSSNSSRTSCTSGQELAAATDLDTSLLPCEDQDEQYTYRQDGTSPQISVPASALPIANNRADTSQLDENSSALIADQPEMVIRNRNGAGKCGTASPSGLKDLYGYSRNTRRSSRRNQDMLTTLLTSGFSSGSGPWTASPTSSTRSGSFEGHQSMGNGEQYGLNIIRSPSVPLDMRCTY